MLRLTAVAILLSLFVQAQDSIKVIEPPVFYYREDVVVMSLTSDNWTDLPSGIESKPLRSRGFSMLIMTELMNKQGNFGIGGGLGFMSQNVHTNAYITDTGSASALTPVPDSVDLEVNKLSSNFVTAAFELRLRSKKDLRGNRWKFNAGFLAGFLVQSHIKYEDKSGKIKTYDIEHLNTFQYGLMARMGYNKVAISGYYSLVPVFQDGEGPEMTPYCIGISLTL